MNPIKSWFTKSEKTTKRAKVPTLIQIEAVECGAASLGIILRYFGNYEPLEKLRIACGISRDGSKASKVMKAAREYGLDAKGYRKEPKDLRAMPTPMIVHWNFNHFLVVEGFKRGKVYLNDPATGPRVVSEEEFDQSFTGIVLTFAETEKFKKQPKPNLLGKLKTRITGSGSPLFYVFLTGLALVIPGLAIPMFLKIFVDEILIGTMHNWLVPLLIGMALTAALRMGLKYLQQHYLLRLQTKISLSMSSRFLWHIFHLPIEFFSQRYAGEISNRVGINDKVAQMLTGDLATSALNVVVVVFYLILMLQYSVILTAVTVVMALLNIVYLRFVNRKRSDMNQKLLKDNGKLHGVTISGMQLIETIKATGGEGDFFSKWAGYQSKTITTRQTFGVWSQFLSHVPKMLTSVANAAILTFGGLLIMNGNLTIGTLVAFQSLMMSFLNPVNDLVSFGGRFQEVEGDINRLDDVLNYQADPGVQISPQDVGKEAFIKLTGKVELVDMTFGYSLLEPPLIEEFHLKLSPGERIALIGTSGSGKSTISKQVAGLYQPWSGEILFDDKPRNQWPRHIINRSVAMVDQDISLYEGTIKDNITLWDSTIPETDIIRAAKDACIHEDIVGRPGGYDSKVEEGGGNFSGGQRQRLEIARALAGNPSILILDEATSALDPTTEKKVDESLRRRGCTCLIVAHRLSTIRDCDEIIVMHKGKVVERGTHDQLIKTDSHYAKLAAMN